MKVQPYRETGSKKEQVQKMFDNIAGSYDLLNHLLSFGIDRAWRRKAIATLIPINPQKILDVATGTADLAIEAQKQVNPKEIYGIDLSEKMLARGRMKIENKNLGSVIKLESGDCENLRFGENTFDAVTVAFGVRNYENLEKGLNEMYRILKPGGMAVILEFTKPRYFPFKQVFNIYFKYVLPVIGKIKSKDPRAYHYLYESVQAFPDFDRLCSILEEIGFKHCEWKSLSLGICAIYSAKKLS